MRVLQVMAGKGNGGAELYSTDVMLSLHEAGLDQCVVMRPDAPRAGALAAAGLRMAPEVLAAPVGFLRRRRMRALIARETPDIIHCWMRRAASLVPAGGAREMIGWLGDYEDYRHFAHCTRFVGVTRDLIAHIARDGAPVERTAYIPTFPTVDEAEALDRATLRTPEGGRVLLTLSRLHPTKGLDTALRALVRLPDCYLWVAGDGPERAALERLAGALGVAERVRFLGWRTDRGALLRAADICLLPSRYEPFGTVILDAWQAGTAFVACAAQGPLAYIRDGENGMLVAPDDEAALAGAIRRVLDDPALRERIVARGRAEYLADFTRAAVTRRMLGYYKGLLDAA
jgi:glycosyltransferase involved in cell wall biosynthesis